jgi:hypothetical protein
MRLTHVCALLAVAGLPLSGCDGPSAPSLVKGEPVCTDIEQAGIKLKGGLKQPVQLRVLDDGDLVATVMLYGVPESTPQPTRFLLPGGDGKYTLEWGQCPNERALTAFDPRDKAAGKSATGGSYDCGTAVVYHSVEHATKKGDATSHEIEMVAPPNPDCWVAPKKK